MKKILYMHSGSGNHGCEAIVRTTSELLGGPNDVKLWSLTKPEDVHYGVSDCVEDIIESEQLEKYSLPYFEALIKRKLLHKKNANLQVFLKELFKNSIAISIGGDNYCYEWSANQNAELNNTIRKYCKFSVLWGCSIDPEAITPEIKDDLSKYDLITVREQITYNLLRNINKNTVKVADPAFLLEKIELPLSVNFIEDNTVGINISPLIMDYGTEGSLILQNYEELVTFILNETDMNICFIPHVVWDYNNDMKPINYLCEKFINTGRVCKIDDANCMELKGYISRCRFFVGARTHATIAAYSTLVPTLVVGYSVKSRGIAKDLFGTDEHYVVPVQQMKNKSDLKNNFVWMLKNESTIKQALTSIIPKYKEQAKKSVDYFNQMLKGE